MTALDRLFHRLTYVPELMRENKAMRTMADHDADNKLFADALAEYKEMQAKIKQCEDAPKSERGQAAGELLLGAFILLVVMGCPIIAAAMFWGANGY